MSALLIILSLLFCAGYVGIISLLAFFWSKVPEDLVPTYDFCEGNDLPKISVVIAARNEENSIVSCIESILKNNFPVLNYEILIVDDHSQDTTVQKIRQLDSENIQILQNFKTGKKSALTCGLQQAQYDIILCTDADCKVPKNWLYNHSVFYKNNPNKKLCVGFVLPDISHSHLSRFQWLDYAATMAMTIVGHKRAGFYLGNGAHLSYRKSAFFAVGGYESDGHVASGDDIFLIKKVAEKFSNSIGFIKNKDSIVHTQPEKSWVNLWQQRKRWATKSSHVKDKKVTLVQAWIFIFVLLCILTLMYGFVTLDISLILVGLILFSVKISTDYFFLYYLAKYFNVLESMRFFLISSTVYIYHILKSGFMALRPSEYQWKDRVVR